MKETSQKTNTKSIRKRFRNGHGVEIQSFFLTLNICSVVRQDCAKYRIPGYNHGRRSRFTRERSNELIFMKHSLDYSVGFFGVGLRWKSSEINEESRIYLKKQRRATSRNYCTWGKISRRSRKVSYETSPSQDVLSRLK